MQVGAESEFDSRVWCAARGRNAGQILQSKGSRVNTSAHRTLGTLAAEKVNQRSDGYRRIPTLRHVFGTIIQTNPEWSVCRQRSRRHFYVIDDGSLRSRHRQMRLDPRCRLEAGDLKCFFKDVETDREAEKRTAYDLSRSSIQNRQLKGINHSRPIVQPFQRNSSEQT